LLVGASPNVEKNTLPYDRDSQSNRGLNGRGKRPAAAPASSAETPLASTTLPTRAGWVKPCPRPYARKPLSIDVGSILPNRSASTARPVRDRKSTRRTPVTLE